MKSERGKKRDLQKEENGTVQQEDYIQTAWNY